MNERERHNNIGRTSARKAISFVMCPTQCRAGIGEVHAKGQEIGSFLFFALQVGAFNARGIDVERAREMTALAGDTAKNTRVRAQVPDCALRNSFKKALDE